MPYNTCDHDMRTNGNVRQCVKCGALMTVPSARLDRFNPADEAGYGMCRAAGFHNSTTRHARAQCPTVVR